MVNCCLNLSYYCTSTRGLHQWMCFNWKIFFYRKMSLICLQSFTYFHTRTFQLDSNCSVYIPFLINRVCKKFILVSSISSCVNILLNHPYSLIYFFKSSIYRLWHKIVSNLPFFNWIHAIICSSLNPFSIWIDVTILSVIT